MSEVDLDPHIPSDFEWAKIRLLNCHLDECKDSHLIISSPNKIFAIGCYHIGLQKISLKILDNSIPLDKKSKLLSKVISQAWSSTSHQFNSLKIQVLKHSAEYDLLKQHEYSSIENLIEYRGAAILCHEAIALAQKRHSKKSEYVIEQLTSKNIESQLRHIKKNAIKLDVMSAEAFDKMISILPEGPQSLKSLSFVALAKQKIIGVILAYATKSNLFAAARYVHPEVLDVRVSIDLMERFYWNAKQLYGDQAPIHFTADSIKHKKTVNLSKRLKAKPIYSNITFHLVR